MTKEQLLERAETVHTRLRTRLDQLPDAEDAPTDRLCDAIRAEALNGRSVAGRLRNQMLNVQKPKKSLDLKPLEAWRDTPRRRDDAFRARTGGFRVAPRGGTATPLHRDFGRAVCAQGDREWPEHGGGRKPAGE